MSMTAAEAARLLDVSPATLRRWVDDGLVPLERGEWTRTSLAQARIVARLRARGHPIDEIREATREGRLAYGYLEDLFPAPPPPPRSRRPRRPPDRSPPSSGASGPPAGSPP